jgi:hypothetical protein
MGLLNPEEQATFHSLQSRLDAGETLTGEESGDFERLALLIEEREAEYLCPANERLSLEAERLAGENEFCAVPSLASKPSSAPYGRLSKKRRGNRTPSGGNCKPYFPMSRLPGMRPEVREDLRQAYNFRCGYCGFAKRTRARV